MRLGATIRCLISALLLAFLADGAMAQLWPAVGPDGGDVRSLALDPRNPDRVFLGTSAGRLYLSTDGGASWVRYAHLGPSTGMALDHIIVDPTDSRTMYVAAWSVDSPHSDGDIFRSRDAGQTWETLPDMHGQSVRALTLAPSSPRMLVAGTLEGVFRSRDGGDHWERISPEHHREIRNVESVAVDPENANVIYAGTWHLPWKTEDGGKTWHSIKAGVIDDSDVFSVVVDPVNSSVVYISACSGIYKSITAGQTFSKIQGIPYSARRTRALVMDPADSSVLYAGTTEGLWKSADGGTSWKRMTATNVIINAVIVDPRRSSRVLLATDRGGVLTSDDGGSTFAASNHGFAHRQASALLIDRNDSSVIYVGLLNDKEFGGVFVSRDGGRQWAQISDGLGGRDVFVLRQAEDGSVVAGTNRGIFELQPHAAQWTPLNVVQTETGRGKAKAESLSFTELGAPITGLALVGGKWYAATSAGLLVSTDAGRIWQKAVPNAVKDLVSISSQGNIVVAASHHAVIVSTDGGESWFAPGFPQSIVVINSVSIDTKGAIWLAAREGAFRSLDLGDSWQRVTALPLVNVAAIRFDPENRRILASGPNSSDIFESSNNGHSWRSIGCGWTVRDLHANHGRLVAITEFDGVVMQPASQSATEISRTGNR
ncbi:MAG TPA: YCF48-related protein [Verrucomicrobiae bacterium]|jgi:photosystem II stability/assembly factor-like uncharacterized protein|nr:YCF48-related protein [Verrucomicrobiae bacterium]